MRFETNGEVSFGQISGVAFPFFGGGGEGWKNCKYYCAPGAYIYTTCKLTAPVLNLYEHIAKPATLQQ